MIRRGALALTALLSSSALAATCPQTVTHDAGWTLLQTQPELSPAQPAPGKVETAS